MKNVIQFKNVSKRFIINDEGARSIQELLISFFTRRRKASKSEEFWALRDVSFEVPQGKTIGLIGTNGSGKSTALKLMTGILQPTQGEIYVDGRISALLELGSGMHPDLTGRENVFLNGSLLGFSNHEMRKLYPKIIEFSELKRFIDTPVKHYSSGMYMRLAFSVAIHVQPDILLLDEVLAVGDQSFQTKCLDRIYQMRKNGTTIVMVSHGLESLQDFCDELIWLNKGQFMGQGETGQIAGKYQYYIYQLFRQKQSNAAPPIEEEQESSQEEQESSPPQIIESNNETTSDVVVSEEELVSDEEEHKSEEATLDEDETLSQEATIQKDEALSQEATIQKHEAPSEKTAPEWRWGSREVEITEVRLRSQNQYTEAFLTGDPFTVEIHYTAHQPIDDPMFGLAIHHANGTHINGPNNKFAGFDIKRVEGSGVIYYTIPDLPLMPGTYEVSVSAYDAQGIHGYDTHWRVYRFHVYPGNCEERYGMFFIPSKWEHRAQKKVLREQSAQELEKPLMSAIAH